MNDGHAFAVVPSWQPSFTEGCEPRTVGAIGSISCRGVNRLLAFRRNSVDSNGGFLIGASTDVLVENNQVTPPEHPMACIVLPMLCMG